MIHMRYSIIVQSVIVHLFHRITPTIGIQLVRTVNIPLRVDDCKHVTLFISDANERKITLIMQLRQCLRVRMKSKLPRHFTFSHCWYIWSLAEALYPERHFHLFLHTFRRRFAISWGGKKISELDRDGHLESGKLMNRFVEPGCHRKHCFDLEREFALWWNSIFLIGALGNGHTGVRKGLMSSDGRIGTEMNFEGMPESWRHLIACYCYYSLSSLKLLKKYTESRDLLTVNL